MNDTTCSKISTIHLLAGIFLLKVTNRNTRTRCKICSKLTINKTEGRRHKMMKHIQTIRWFLTKSCFMIFGPKWTQNALKRR